MSRSPKHIALLAIWAAATAAWSQPNGSAASDTALTQVFGDYRDELLVFDEVASDSALAVYRFRGARARSRGAHIVMVTGKGVPAPHYCYDCLDYMRDNIPTVSALQAVEIAERNGLTRGLRPWRISHHRSAGDLRTFVWTVHNTESVVERRGSGQSWGQTIVIDDIYGGVLKELQWHSHGDGVPRWPRSQRSKPGGTRAAAYAISIPR